MLKRKLSQQDQIDLFWAQIDDLAQSIEKISITEKNCPSENRCFSIVDEQNFSKRTNVIKGLFQQMVMKTSLLKIFDSNQQIDCSSFVKRINFDILDSKKDNDQIKKLLDLVVPVKLCGGLGTTMKCPFPKCFIEIMPQTTFLDLSIKQLRSMNRIYGSKIPLVLMTSFNTKADIDDALEYYKRNSDGFQIKTFEQSVMPRISAETHCVLPCNYNSFKKEEWYPPGHGDFYESFHRSGLLDKFISDGKEWAFVSNIDNPGAYPEAPIIEFLKNKEHDGEEIDFANEVTRKTLSDIKGGVFIKQGDSINLIESSQIPQDKIENFKGNDTFRYFNTNNVWINLKAIKKLVEGNQIQTDVIINKKILENNHTIIQLESAISSAIHCFANPVCFEVERNRFIPVKKCEDLLPLTCNLINFDSNGFCPKNMPILPLIKLGYKFTSLKDFKERISKNLKISKLIHLTVNGDVRFGNNVELRGNVIIIANRENSISIPDGSIIENKVITGSLYIDQH